MDPSLAYDYKIGIYFLKELVETESMVCKIKINQAITRGNFKMNCQTILESGP